MKRRTKELRCRVGSVKLYLDDIRELVRVMRPVSDEGELKIESRDYEFAGVEELGNLNRDALHKLKIVYGKSSSRVSVLIDGSSVVVECDEDAPTFRGVYAEIGELLESRKRWWNWIDSNWVYGAMGASVGLSVLLIMMATIYVDLLMGWCGFGFAMVFLIFLLTRAAARNLRVSEIVLQERSEHESFWQRNKDKITLALITALVTMVFSIIGTLIVLAITGVNPLLTAP